MKIRVMIECPHCGAAGRNFAYVTTGQARIDDCTNCKKPIGFEAKLTDRTIDGETRLLLRLSHSQPAPFTIAAYWEQA